MTISPERRKTILLAAALALGTLLLFAPAWKFDFIDLDDPLYVLENYHLRGGAGWHDIAWSFSTGYGSNWIPLVWLSYMLDFHFWNFNPAGYHITNVVLHAANAVLIFLVLRQMTKAKWRSAIVAALFAWHPAHVESVAWITERKDVLSTLFWWLTLGAYVKYTVKRSWGWYALMLMAFALGLMSKPMVVTLPFVLLLLDGWPLGRFATANLAPEKAASRSATSVTGLILEKVPLLILAMVASVVAYVMQKQAGAVAAISQFPLLARVANALVGYSFYLQKLIWPSKLSVLYPLQVHVPAAAAGTALFGLAAITAWVVRFRRPYPYAFTGWLWFLGTLVPVIGLVQVGMQGMADRYTYLPSIGIFIFATWGLAEVWVKFSARQGELIPAGAKKLAAGAVIVIVLTSYAAAAEVQLRYWRTSGTLLARAIELEPKNFMAHSAYGIVMFRSGRLAEAQEEFSKSVDLAPQFGKGHSLLGKVLVQLHKPDEAAVQFRRALELDPGDVAAYADLGAVLLDRNLPTEAQAEVAQALKIEPENPALHGLMGKVLGAEGKFDEAEAEFQDALRRNPQLTQAHYDLALTMERRGDIPGAITEYHAVLALQPHMLDAMNNLAWILATSPRAELRNGNEAVQLARSACALTHEQVPFTLGTLAAAEAEAGNFDQAVVAAQKAHDAAIKTGHEKLAAKDLQLMTIFRMHQAFHSSL